MPARPDKDTQRNTGLGTGRAGYSVVVDSDAFGVRKVLLDLAGFAARLGVAKDDLASVQLVLAEVLNNIVEHACRDTRDATIRVSCRFGPTDVAVAVMDNGRPLQGGKAPDSVLSRQHDTIESLPEGGFGWFIIRRLTQDLSYRRRTGRNYLMFTIPFQGI